MSKAIILHEIEAAPVGQRAGDGFIDATAMCKAVGKLFADYQRLASTKDFLAALGSDMGIPISGLIVTVKGGRGQQGTWVHPDVAIDLAAWCSPRFRVAVMRWVREWMMGGANPEEQQARLWGQQREQGKVARKGFCGVLASHGVESPEDFSHATNAIYSGTLGKTAKELREEMGLKKSHSIRDRLKGAALAAVALAEHATATRIEWNGDVGQECIRRARQVAHEIGRVLDPAQHLPAPKAAPITEEAGKSAFAQMRTMLVRGA